MCQAAREHLNVHRGRHIISMRANPLVTRNLFYFAKHRECGTAGLDAGGLTTTTFRFHEGRDPQSRVQHHGVIFRANVDVGRRGSTRLDAIR